MECPFCKSEMKDGEIKCYKCAPMWKGVNGRKFTFGKAKLFINRTQGALYCEKCDCLIIKKVGDKIEH